MQATPATTISAPRILHGVIGLGSNPSNAKWSSSTDDSNWPATTAEMKAAAPSRGMRAAPDSTIIAPNGPPIQFHQGVDRMVANGGTGGR